MDSYKNTLESWFPNLIVKDYKIISFNDKRDYNCVSYSLDIFDHWTWINENWPSNIPQNLGLMSFKLLYLSNGYIDCHENSSFEENYLKIAFYEKSGAPIHASKQFGNMWRSRINYGIIEHELEWLEGTGEAYGKISFIMKKII